MLQREQKFLIHELPGTCGEEIEMSPRSLVHSPDSADSPRSFSKPSSLSVPPGVSEFMNVGWGWHIFGFKVSSLVLMFSLN